MRQPIFLIHLCFFALASISTEVYSQEYSWRYYSIADGLPQTQVYCLYQDSKGYVWIGTKGGLSKFDGIEFENYTSKDGLVFDFVSKFQEDATGGIYVGTKNGTTYLKNGKIIPQQFENSRGGQFLFADKNDVIWLYSASSGLELYSGQKKITDHPVLNYNLKDFGIIHFSIEVANNILLLNSFNRESIIWNGSTLKILPKPRVSIRPHLSEKGQLYGTNEDSLFQYINQEFRPLFSLKGHQALLVQSWDEIYLTDNSTHSKLFLFDGKEVHEFHQKFNMIMDLLVDDEHNLWVGTESGLWRLQSKGFKNYLSNRDDNFYTWSVLEGKNGNYWFASFSRGLKKFDGREFKQMPVNHHFKDRGYQFFYSGGYVDKEQNILFGTTQGILKFDGNTFDWFYRDKINDAILYMYFDQKLDHYYVASSRHGLVELDIDGKVLNHNDHVPKENTGLVTCVIKDKFNRIWISGKRGISIKEDNRWYNLPTKKDSIPIGAISMIKDHRGNIWLGSNAGLFYYNYNKLIQIEPGTFNKQIGVLNMTNNQELLIGSINGIGLLDLQTFYSENRIDLRFFDTNNGFLGTECKHNSSFKDSKGSIWICTSDRVVEVIPESLKTNTIPPRVYIESISTLSENMEWNPTVMVYQPGSQYEFETDNDDLRFNYHGINHSAPNSIRYQTILEGYDNAWSAVTTERYRTYTNLPKGDYTFKVKAYNIDGSESINYASTSFSILPDWHEMSSVRISGLVFVIIAAALFGYFYSDKIKKSRLTAEQNEKRIARLQFKALRGLIDPHFTFNAINSIAAMVYKENRDEAYTYFTKFSKLIRSAFDTSDDTTRTIKEELSFVANYLDIEKMRFKDRFDYKIEVDKKVNYDWKIPKMIIQIYVENAIKHGLIEKEKGGLVEVNIHLLTKYLQISIKDNGVGRKYTSLNQSDQNSLGKGTTIMKEYFMLLNKFNELKIKHQILDLYHNNGEAKGTEIRISVPLNFKYNL